MTLLPFSLTGSRSIPFGDRYPYGIVTNIDVPNSYSLDADIRKVDESFPAPNKENIEWAFWNENTSQSWGYVSVAMICGEGFDVVCNKKSRKEEVEKLVNAFNADINWSHQTIYDYIRDHWFDNLVHNYSLWRIRFDANRETRCDIGRCDPQTLTEVSEPTMGYKMFIQQAHVWEKEYERAEDFFTNYDPVSPPIEKSVYVKIPVTPETCIYSSHFHQAPAKTALKYMVTKLWVLYFMRKYAEKHWAPLIAGMIGEPGKYIPQKKEMAAIAEQLKTTFQNIHNFSSITLPGYIRIEAIQPSSSGKSGQVYMDAIDLLDKQIMFSLMASMAMREASGRELSTQRGIKELWELVIKGFRREIERDLLTFYSKSLLPMNGIGNVEVKDLEIIWPDLEVLPEVMAMSQSVDLLARLGAIEKSELRGYMRKAIKNLDENNDEGKIKIYEPPVKAIGSGTVSSRSSTKPAARKASPSKAGR